MPQPLGKRLFIRCFVHSDHSGDKLSRRFRISFTIFINGAPIIWSSRREATILGKYLRMRICCYLGCDCNTQGTTLQSTNAQRSNWCSCVPFRRKIYQSSMCKMECNPLFASQCISKMKSNFVCLPICVQDGMQSFVCLPTQVRQGEQYLFAPQPMSEMESNSFVCFPIHIQDEK